MRQPVIGIVLDNRDNAADSGKYEVGIGYSRCVSESDGVPLLLPHEPQLADRYVHLCDGLILTGGVDPHTEAFGEPTHPKARPVDARRQAFDLAILDAIDRCDQGATIPVLGVCLGMQMMALHAGGKLNQYMPDTLQNADAHVNHKAHPIEMKVDDSVLPCAGEEPVISHHQQAVRDAGRMRVVAEAAGGVIEAIDDPTRAFYLGVQWHPERGGPGPLNQGLLARLVDAARAAT